VTGPRGFVRAAASLGLSGRYAVQAREALAGLELWATDCGVDLVTLDDEGTPSRAVGIYRDLLAEGTEILVGPYGSHTVRQVAPVVCGTGRVLWNHGGAGDDLPAPGLASVVAPASSYLNGLVRLARDRGLDEVVVVTGPGRFAQHVGDGALTSAAAHGLRARRVRAGDWDAPVDGEDRSQRPSLHHAALVFVATFDEDVAAVGRVRGAGLDVGLLGCVAAGIDEFGRRLGSRADGVVGPVQWWRRDEPAEVGPSGPEFARRFEQRTGREPDYVAAQAAAAGYLAFEAHRRGYGPADIRRWRTSSLLGPFRLDRSWRQAGHAPATVQWRDGRRVLAADPATGGNR
jgi:ABC-type branched-subunit amino acid transport system substrate-binding protein